MFLYAFPSQHLPVSSLFFSPPLSFFLLLLRLESCTRSQPIFQIETLTFGKQATYPKLCSPDGTQGIPNTPHSLRPAPDSVLPNRAPRPNYPVAGAPKGVLTLYCLQILLGPKAGNDLEEALKGGQKENDLARTARPRSDPLKMTRRDPKTRARHLTCCSCSVRKLTSCFRLSPPPHSLGLHKPRPRRPIVRPLGSDGRRFQPVYELRTAPPSSTHRPRALWVVLA